MLYIIGDFIFTLGYHAALTRKGLSNKAVQLVQQTPDEELLRDLGITLRAMPRQGKKGEKAAFT